MEKRAGASEPVTERESVVEGLKVGPRGRGGSVAATGGVNGRAWEEKRETQKEKRLYGGGR